MRDVTTDWDAHKGVYMFREEGNTPAFQDRLKVGPKKCLKFGLFFRQASSWGFIICVYCMIMSRLRFIAI